MHVKLKKSSTLLSIFKIGLKTLRLVLSKLLFLAIAKNDFSFYHILNWLQ